MHRSPLSERLEQAKPKDGRYYNGSAGLIVGICSLRSKRFQSSYCAKVRAGVKKKVEGGGGGEKRKRLPANPTILKNAP